MKSYEVNMQKLLFIAAELHKRGYEKLRVEPSISPNGMAWRCRYFVVLGTEKESLTVSNWKQIEEEKSIKELSDMLEKENIDFFSKCKGESNGYVQWFNEMLSGLQEGELPYAYDDYFLPTNYWKTTLGNEIKTLPGGFRLEITMESRAGDKHSYIKRSFPAEKGTIDISKYGYPYIRYRTIQIGNIIGQPIDIPAGTEIYLELNFAGTNYKIFLNSFLTVKKEYAAAHIDPYLKLPVPGAAETVHTTFYLYIE